MREHGAGFDPIQLEMLWSRLLSISDEMAVTLTRTAFSPIVRDAHDYGCSVFDADGNMIAMGEDATPGLSVSAMVSVKHMLKVYPAETLKPGDVLITNDPWLATGHLPDITVVTPVFCCGHLAGFAATVAHHMDIGGRKYSPSTTEIYEEGLLLPVLKLFEAGQPNDTIFRILAGNVRVPDLVLGDVHAQVSANALGSRRICDLVEQNGWQDLNPLGRQVMDRAESAMRVAIAAVPDGCYRSELPLDGFDHPLRIVTTIHVAGSELFVDFTGTSPQVNRGINCVLPITQGLVLLALQLAVRPDVPTNAGVARPLRIHAPEGSLLAARHPAPVVARSLVLDHLQPAIFLALADAIPERISATSGGPIWSERFFGNRTDGSPFYVVQLLNGGMGARPGRDGVSALSFPNNCATIPTETLEEAAPLVIERKGLVRDSGGPGRFRGGLSQEFRVRILPEAVGPVIASLRADRTINAAMGMRGGHAGTLGSILRNGSEPLPPKQPVTLQAGDVVSWQLAGGGGYGKPIERDPELVLADVVDGLVSPEAAERDYGVKVRASDHGWEIDSQATARLRQAAPGAEEG